MASCFSFFSFFAVELWSFTGGMAALEEMRTFRSFCRDAAADLKGVPDDRIALYPGGDSSLIFYLNRSRLTTLADVADVKRFLGKFPHGFIISESKQVETLKKELGRDDLVVVLAQAKEPYSKGAKGLLLLRPAIK